jgi:hypothetical protein
LLEGASGAVADPGLARVRYGRGVNRVRERAVLPDAGTGLTGNTSLAGERPREREARRGSGSC